MKTPLEDKEYSKLLKLLRRLTLTAMTETIRRLANGLYNLLNRYRDDTMA